MDEIIEQGFDRLQTLINETKQKQNDAFREFCDQNVTLLLRMIDTVAPIAREIGSVFLLKAKQDIKGELYDQEYYSEKMIVLGKTDSPLEYRPDDLRKKITQQYCVLSEKGMLYELMFSNDGFIVDTYTSPLTPKDALEFYGYDIIYMLYSAMKDYHLAEKEVLDALSLALGYIQKKT
jgi:chaperonin cofactor prefoldin